MKCFLKVSAMMLVILLSLEVFAFDNSARKDKSAEKGEVVEALNIGDYRGWLIGVGYFSLEKNNASDEGIGSNATFFKLGWEGQKGSLTYALGMEGFLLSDKDSFRVTVEDSFGDISNESSSAEGYGVYGELGYSLAFADTMKLDLMGGVDILWASRGIGNCSDCPSEDVNLDGGFYIEPRLRFINESGLNVTLGYRQYMNSDIENGISLNFSWVNPS